MWRLYLLPLARYGERVRSVDVRGSQPGELSAAIVSARAAGRTAVVADVKLVSPRDGDLLGDRRPAELARSYEAAGACALSVVTEAENFGGSCDTLQEVVGAVSLPVLRKDFLTDPEQLEESARMGASAVLLIAATMSDELMARLYRRARELGLEPVVEVHTHQELARALRLEPTIVGINNRDILQLEKDAGDVATTETLAPLVPEGIVTLSESSLLTTDQVQRALAAGADAVLIGTMLLQAEDPAAPLRELTAL